MQSEFDERLEAILCQAVEIESAEQRIRFLNEACAGDLHLRANVDKLVQNHFAAGSFLEHPAVGATQEFDETTGVADHRPLMETVPLDFLDPSEEPGSLGRLGRYEILEVVGRGGMGIVLKARDTNLQRIVAVKVLAPELAANATARKRFLREAQAAAAMSDTHIVTIYAVEENGGSPRSSVQAPLPFLVMEFIDGLSLQEKLDRQGSLELKEILRIGRQIASGLAAAHHQGLIHRDIKPANILLQNGVQRVQITDFGLARAIDDVEMTRTGEVSGTPVYMSPEQAMGQPMDGRSDLFSLGSVLYAMCTGRAPFRAETTIAVLRRVCDERPRPVRHVTPEIPESLAALIDRLLEKDPNHRFQSATEVADLLRKLANLQARHSSPPDMVTSGRTGSPRSMGLRKGWMIACGALLVLAASLGLAEATGTTHLVATVIRIFTPEGTLVIETDDPGVKVSIEGDGGIVITGAGPQEVRLRPGSYRVLATKDGKPVRQEELVTITRGGKQVVRVRLESEAAPASAAITGEQGAFIVQAGSGVVERKFDTLAEAVQRSSNGDTIEIRGNGPFVTEPVFVKERALTIRAGAGYRPVFHLGSQGSRAFAPLLSSDSPLTLEGLEFHRLDPSEWNIHLGRGSPRLVDSRGDIRVTHCRFVMKTQGHGIVVQDAAVCEIRYSEFISSPNTFWMGGVSWGPTTDGRFIMDNCVKAGGGTAIVLWYNRPGQKEAIVRLSRNTLVGNTAVVFNLDCLPDGDGLKDNSKIPVFRIEAMSNVFCPHEAILRFDQAPSFLAKVKQPLGLAEATALLPRLFSWHEQGSLYSPRKSDFLTFSEYGQLKQHHAPLIKLADWHGFWDQQNTRSMEGTVRLQGGDLLHQAQTEPEQLTPEDFQLRADSAGYRAGPDGKDLGADVDLVGPGEAYERWKKTPEYQEWLKDAKQRTDEAAKSARAAAEKSSRERQSADVFVRHGGNVVLWTPTGVAFLLDKPGQPWPSGEWHVRLVNVDGSTTITSSDLAALRDFPRLGEVGLANTQVTTAAVLDHIEGKPVAQLSLNNVPTTRADAARLAKIKTLNRIFVVGADWGDDDIAQLAGLPLLRKLNISSTKITDRSLEHLGRLPHLTDLYVAGTKVTDAGLAALHPCKALRVLNVSKTLVTADGVEKLRLALPECEVTAVNIQK